MDMSWVPLGKPECSRSTLIKPTQKKDDKIKLESNVATGCVDGSTPGNYGRGHGNPENPTSSIDIEIHKLHTHRNSSPSSVVDHVASSQSPCLKRSPRFIKEIYWEAGSFLRTPFAEGCVGANEKVSPPGRQQRCIF